MKLFLDTNILVDNLDFTRRDIEASREVIGLCEQMGYQGFISSLSVPNVLYVLRKTIRSHEEKKMVVLSLCRTYKIVPLEQGDLLLATSAEFDDYEDGLQILAAERAGADYIITNDKAGFRHSKIKVLTPREFLVQGK